MKHPREKVLTQGNDYKTDVPCDHKETNYKHMKYLKFLWTFSILLSYSALAFNQVITTVPEFSSVNDEVTVRFDISKCTRKDLVGYTGDVYIHTGVFITSSAQWEHVIAGWSENIAKAKCTRISADVYEIVLGSTVKDYYGIPSSDTATQINFVVRSSDGSKQTEDLSVTLYPPGLSVEFTSPESNLIVTEGTSIDIMAQSIRIGTPGVDSILLYLDGALIHTSESDTVKHLIWATGGGKHWIKVNAINSGFSVFDSAYFFVREDVTTVDLPGSYEDGITYTSDTSAMLVLYAPSKESVFVIGDFNEWKLDNNYLMNKTTDEKRWWLLLDSLEPDEEYAFQYHLDDDIVVADPYTEKVLDPVNDLSIPVATYPNLKAYPEGMTTGIAGVLQTGQPGYTWQIDDFVPQTKNNLVIYELHVQNFTGAGNINALTDTLNYLEKLGVNAVELMPVNEFEGNFSWGYNPSFYFAFDKMYGTITDFKEFVDACHSRGIAVIIDMVLNHSYSQSPLVRMYWDGNNVTPDNPWYNTSCPHSAYCWGFDFNHKSPATNYFVNRVVKYWINEYKVDGYRFDFTKGFTNKVDQYANGPDTMRIKILKNLADSVWTANSNALVIFEHLAANEEEKELADYGILLWGNMNYRYNEATLGYHEYENGSYKSDLTWGSYQARDWDKPNLVTYMESHDEERLMYKNKIFGKTTNQYNTKELETALQRMETAASFFFTIPGPKMIWEFGELGYDYSINTCIDGTVNNCRLDLKPLRWDYYDTLSRYRLFKVYEALIDFKKLGITNTTDFDMDVQRELKKIHLNGTDTNVTVIGNFGVINDSIVPGFQHTGAWYNYMTGSEIEVTDLTAKVKLKPGEYHIYSDVDLITPDLPAEPVIPDVPGTSSLDETGRNSWFEIYPNPSLDGNFNLDYRVNSPDNIIFKLVDFTGKVIFEHRQPISGSGTIPIDIRTAGSQLFIYEIVNSKGTDRGKLLKY